jgi:branched-chain amino acid transport system permease protein
MLEQQLVNALSLGGVYALFSLGFTLVFGVLGIVNLAHGAVFMLGAYASLHAVTAMKLPVAAAMGASMVAAGVAGWLLDRLIFAPLRARHAPHLAPMIATIGVAICCTSAVEGFFGAENLRFPAGLSSDDTLSVGSIRMTWLEVQIILLAFFLMSLLLWAIHRTQLGRALRAVAESKKASALVGIDVEGVYRLTSVAAASLGGMAGVLIALYTNSVFPHMGQPMLHKGIAVVILGGMGDIRGALVGGFFLGFAEVFSVAYIGSTMRDAVAFGLLFAILLLRPQGLFGKSVERRA